MAASPSHPSNPAAADAARIQQVLRLLLGPLDYGARDRGAHLATLRDFERLLQSVVRRARDEGAEPSLLERLLAHGRGFDSASLEARRAALGGLARELGAFVPLPPALAAMASAARTPASPGPAPAVAAATVPAERAAAAPSPENAPASPGGPAAKTRKRVTPKPRPHGEHDGRLSKVGKAASAAAGSLADGAGEEVAGYLPSAPFTGLLATPLEELLPLRGRLATALKTRKLSRVGELLFYLPRAYEDRRSPTPIARLPVGERGLSVGTVTFVGDVVTGSRKMFRVILADRSGSIAASWFTVPSWLKHRYKVGDRWAFTGEIRAFGGVRTVNHPEMEPAEELETDTVNFGRIVPIYPGFERTDQRAFRILCHRVVEQYAGQVEDPLPPELLQRVNLPALAEALREAHFPGSPRDQSAPEGLDALERNQTPAQRRFAFDELFIIQLGLALRRKGVKLEPGIQFRADDAVLKRAAARLPFQLTGAQKRAVRQLARDMGRPEPMNRLLQGDVGSGKTAVALMCACIAIENGYQVALMAPTEILAGQHQRNLEGWLATTGHRTAVLSAGLPKKKKDELKEEIAAGAIHLVVGTHALIQDDVAFARLGLVIVDEQHRFGVMQRGRLMDKGVRPDVLVMTATPIPRTLAMVLYGDLELSVLDELPPGRTPIRTRQYREAQRAQVHGLVAAELAQGRQAYVIYPLVEESEKLDLASATTGAQELAAVFARHRVGLLHGRMNAEEKDAVMAGFRDGAIHILVSTTVVEVGVDVPNATVMVIEAAERFGLSQLHQLRGRVGRGSAQSFCHLIGGKQLSQVARERLSIMEQTSDGFAIAEADLRIRGPGEFLGTRQSGVPGLSVADLARDLDLLELAKEEAQRLVDGDPRLEKPEHAALRRALEGRWEGKLGLARIG